MNIFTGLFCSFCFGYGLVNSRPWLVMVAAILGYFVVMATGEVEND